MLNVPGSISTKTGVAPDLKIASPVAVNVNGVVMILSFLAQYSFSILCNARARKPSTRASVPEDIPTQLETPKYPAILSSSALTSGPKIHRWCSRHLAIASSISFFMYSYSSFKSSIGIGFITSPQPPPVYFFEFCSGYGNWDKSSQTISLFLQTAHRTSTPNLFVWPEPPRPPHKRG